MPRPKTKKVKEVVKVTKTISKPKSSGKKRRKRFSKGRAPSSGLNPQIAAREAAVTYLNAKYAIKSGILAGVADPELVSCTLVPSMTQEQLPAVQEDTTGEYCLRLCIAPTLADRLGYATTLTSTGVPSTGTAIPDNMYAQIAAAGFTAYRTVGVYVEVRAMSSEFTLNGMRFGTVGPVGFYGSTPLPTMQSVRAGFKMGNNKTGDIMGLFLTMDDPLKWRGIADVYTTDADDLQVHINLVSTDAQSYEVSVWAVTQLLPIGNTLVQTGNFLADPLEFAMCVSNALAVAPQFSMQRCAYADDWGSIWSGIKKAWGVGQKVKGFIEDHSGDIRSVFRLGAGAAAALGQPGAAAALAGAGEVFVETPGLTLQSAASVVGLAAQGVENNTVLNQILTAYSECKYDEAALLDQARSIIGLHVAKKNERRSGRAQLSRLRLETAKVGPPPSEAGSPPTSQRSSTGRYVSLFRP
jgi:hypothetical protein